MRAPELKIISWNLLHTNGARPEDVGDLMAQHCPDIVVMQEATSSMDTLSSRFGGYYARAAFPRQQHGVAIWSRISFEQAPVSLKLQDGFTMQRVYQILMSGEFAIANVHLSQDQLLNRLQLRQVATSLPERAAIIGDCNLLGSPLLHNFQDIGPRQPTFTLAGFIPLRPDRCLTRNWQCLSSRVLEVSASDHKPILVTLVARPYDPPAKPEPVIAL